METNTSVTNPFRPSALTRAAKKPFGPSAHTLASKEPFSPSALTPVLIDRNTGEKLASPEISPGINFEKALSTLTYGPAEHDVPPEDQVLNVRKAAIAANIPPEEIDILIFRALAKQLKAALEAGGYKYRTNIDLINIAADPNSRESNDPIGFTITGEEQINLALLKVIDPEVLDDLEETAENSNTRENNITDLNIHIYIKKLEREFISAFENLVRTLYDKVQDPTKLEEDITY